MEKTSCLCPTLNKIYFGSWGKGILYIFKMPNCTAIQPDTLTVFLKTLFKSGEYHKYC